jgi:hypothetical protein
MAVSNHFGSFLDVTISNSYGGYTGMLRYQLVGYPLGIIVLISNKSEPLRC